MITFEDKSISNRQKLLKLAFTLVNAFILFMVSWILVYKWLEIAHSLHNFFKKDVAKRFENKYNVTQISSWEYNKLTEKNIIIYNTFIQDEEKELWNQLFKPFINK